jgi:hypothetical protein
MADKKGKEIVLEEEKDESSVIDDSALSQNQVDDEASLSAALAKNPLKMMLIRLFIKLKNHLTVIPLIMTVASMVVITFTIPYHVNAMVKLHNDEMNAFYFFCNVLLSLLIVMAYLRVSNKKNNKTMVIVMSALFFLLVGLEITLDFLYLHDIDVETNLFNAMNHVSDDTEYHYIANSFFWMEVHIVCLFVTAALAILAWVLQPLAKKLHIKVR